MNATTVQDYADALTNGAEFPPVVVFHDGADYWLADGFHRLLAHEKAGLVDILADVRQGTKRDALLFAIGANASHGLPRTNKDKRRAVEFLLRDEKWARLGDQWAAKQAGVDRSTIWRIREELRLCNAQPEPETRTGADGKQYPTRKAKKTTTDAADLRAAVDADNAELAEIGREIDAANGHEDLGAVVGKAYHRVSEHAFPAVDEMARTRRAEIDRQERAARHPLLDELDGAADRDALDRVYSKAAVANLNSDEAEVAGEVYRRRLSELRAKATPEKTDAEHLAEVDAMLDGVEADDDAICAAASKAGAFNPPPISTPKSAPKQVDLFTGEPAPASQPAQTPAPSDEVAALRAENASVHQWIESTAARVGRHDESTVRKIMHLIALAGSPNENEARSAAYRACALIRERGLLVGTFDQTRASDDGISGDTFEALRREQVEFWSQMTQRMDDFFEGRQS